MKGQFAVKYLIFREIWKISCVVQIPCVVPKFPVFSLSGKSDNQIPCFPCAVAPLQSLCLKNVQNKEHVISCISSQKECKIEKWKIVVKCNNWFLIAK